MGQVNKPPSKAKNVTMLPTDTQADISDPRGEMQRVAASLADAIYSSEADDIFEQVLALIAAIENRSDCRTALNWAYRYIWMETLSSAEACRQHKAQNIM